MTAPRLFDRALLDRHRRRAALTGVADFLLRHVADDMAERLGAVLRRFEAGVEVGSVSPVVAQALAASAGRIVRIGPAVGQPDIVAEEDMLPLGEGVFDLAVSALALHFVDDLPGALVQIRRALKPDGLLLAAILGGNTLKELRESFTAAEIEAEGGASPRVLPAIDVRDAGALLQRAGFALPVTDAETLTVRYRDVFGLMADLRAMAATNIMIARRRTPLRRRTLLRMAEIYRERFADADGRIRASFEIVWLSGWVPHESQQKPLRPGSAKARLADALGVEERSAGDGRGR